MNGSPKIPEEEVTNFLIHQRLSQQKLCERIV